MHIDFDNWISVIFFIAWLAGIALAHGFWLVLLAIIFPPYAWFLVIAKLMLMAGML